jgi:hypothetical protein
MTNDMDSLLKNYFENEVSHKMTPPMPSIGRVEKNKKRKWENLLMTACIAGCCTFLVLPSTYDNAIRKTYVPMSKYEAFKDEIPRIIFDASLYFKDR